MNGLILKGMITRIYGSYILNGLSTVHASQQGDLESAITTFSPVLDKLKAPLSMLLNLTAFGFAILGHMTMLHKPSNVRSVTGAKKNVVLGTITFPPCEE